MPPLNAAGSVSFKAFLSHHESEKPVEVRRFGVEQNEVTSFELLKSKIRQVFPNLKTQEFTIRWIDNENDKIIISTNEELITFLTETTNDVRHLYLTTVKSPISVTIQPAFELKSFGDLLKETVADGNDSEDDDEEGDDVQFTTSGCKRPWRPWMSSNLKFHPHVYCDGCNKHIPGHRYKCLECDDFDLCIDCESHDMHKDHVMLRIPLGKSHFPKLNNFAKGMRYMSDALRKIDNRMKKQERRMHKMYECPFPDLADLADMIPHSKRCKRDEKEKEKKEDRRDKRDKRDKKDRKERECSSSASADCNAEAPGSSSGARTGCPFPSGILSSFLNPQTLGNLLNPENLNTLQQIFEHMSPVPEQLLQEVSRNLADVHLNDNAAPAAPSAPRSGTSTPPTNPFSMGSRKPSAPEADGAVASTSSATQTPVAARKEAESQEPEQQAAQAPPQPENPGSPHSGRSSRSSSEEAEPEGWTVVDSQLRDASSGDQSSVYPKLPSLEPTPEQPQAQANPIASRPPQPLPVERPPQPRLVLHRDADVQNCLRTLAEMGFDVFDQVVVDLAVKYKGNVTRVLSALVA